MIRKPLLIQRMPTERAASAKSQALKFPAFPWSFVVCVTAITTVIGLSLVLKAVSRSRDAFRQERDACRRQLGLILPDPPVADVDRLQWHPEMLDAMILAGSPYRLKIPLMFECQRLLVSTPACQTVDFNGDGEVSQADYAALLDRAKKSWPAWEAGVRRSKDPVGFVQGLVRDAENLRP